MRHRIPLGFILIAIAMVILSFCVRATVSDESNNTQSAQTYLNNAREECIDVKQQVTKTQSSAIESATTQPVTNQTNAQDVELLARIIYCEAGGCTYRHKQLVGSVVINRMNHESFPNTLRGVIFQKGQYYPAESNYLYSVSPDSECYAIAQDLLAYGASDVCPSNVLFQAEFVQGDIYEVIVSPYGSTT